MKWQSGVFVVVNHGYMRRNCARSNLDPYRIDDIHNAVRSAV